MTEPESPSFEPALAPDLIHFGETKPQATVCGWCGTVLPSPDLEACPHCGALLKPTDETLEVPGVTTLGPDALRLLEIAEEKRLRKLKLPPPAVPGARDPAAFATRPSASTPEDAAALQPPDAEVKRLMREMELAARQAEVEVQPPAPAEEPVPAGPDPEPADAGPAPAEVRELPPA